MTTRWMIVTTLATLVILGTIAGAYYLSDGAVDQREWAQTLEYMATVVESALGYIPKEREQLAEGFFRIYTQKHWRTNELRHKAHPDAQFLAHLPDQVPEAPRVFLRNWRTSALREYIRQQAMGLINTVAEPSDVSNISLVELVKLCSEQCRYQLWWEKDGSRRLDVLALNSPALDVAQLPVFYRLFCAGSKMPAWQAETAKLMLSDLRQWQVNGLSDADCEYRPYLVFACYFHLLSHRHFTKQELDLDCYAARFVSRLPDEPLSWDGKFSSEQELTEKLKELLKNISPEEPAQNTQKILEQIRQAMDYRDWHAKFSKLVKTLEEDKTSAKLQNFVARFSRDKR